MGLRERAIQGVAWSAVQNWGHRAINFLVFLVLARLLQPEAFGLVALAAVYIDLITVFVDQGFADALIQRDELDPAHPDTAFWTNLGLGVVFAIGSALLAEPVAGLFGETALGPVIQWLALSFVLAALAGVQEALFERALEYRVLALRSLTAMVIGGTVGIVMALRGWGVWSLVGYQLSERAVAVVVLWTASDWRPGFRWNRTCFHDLFSFGINIVGTSLLGFLNRRSDNLLIGVFLGPTALGFYDVAYKLLNVGRQLLTRTVSSVAFSTFSRLQNDLARMRQALYTATRMVSVIAFPLFLGGAVLAPELIETAFGAKWLPSAPVFRVLALIGVLHAVMYFKPAVLLATGKPDWRLGITALNTVANVAAFALVVQWGIVAVAGAYVVRGYVLAPLMLIAVRKLIGIRWQTYFRGYYAPLASTAVMVGVVWGFKQVLAESWPAPMVVGIGIPLGAAAYLFTLWMLEPERLTKMLDLAKDVIPSTSADESSEKKSEASPQPKSVE